jgi:hypothetical protein
MYHDNMGKARKIDCTANVLRTKFFKNISGNIILHFVIKYPSNLSTPKYLF